MSLQKRYKCLDNLLVAVASLREGDLEKFEENMSLAACDPEIATVLEELDELQENASEGGEGTGDLVVLPETAPDALPPEEAAAPTPEEAGLSERLNERVQRNLKSL